MNQERLQGLLSEIGLTENEAKVYLAGLALGPATVKEIAETAHLKRATVYYTLEQLQQRSLMHEVYKGFKRQFEPHSPDYLEVLYEERKKKLQQALPELQALFNLRGGDSTIQYFEGKTAVRAAYEKVLKSISPHDFYLVMANEEFWKKTDEEFFSDYRKRRAETGTEAKLLLLDTPAAREVRRLQRNFSSSVRLLLPGVSLTTNLVVIPKLTLMHQLVEPNVALIVENPGIVSMHKEMFEIMWNSLEG